MALGNLGRAGVREAVRKITAMKVTGWRKVDAGSSFYPGMVLKLAVVSGKTVVTNVTAATDTPIGIAYSNKADNFYRPVVQEVHTFGENASAANVIYVKPYLLSGSVQVLDSSLSEITASGNYTVDLTVGSITRTGGGSIGATDTVYVNARYRDIYISGIDDTLGSGKVALIEDTGEVATLMYDTTAAWTLGANVGFTTAGLVTVRTSSNTIIGTVTKVPTASEPELCFKLNIG